MKVDALLGTWPVSFADCVSDVVLGDSGSPQLQDRGKHAWLWEQALCQADLTPCPSSYHLFQAGEIIHCSSLRLNDYTGKLAVPLPHQDDVWIQPGNVTELGRVSGGSWPSLNLASTYPILLAVRVLTTVTKHDSLRNQVQGSVPEPGSMVTNN